MKVETLIFIAAASVTAMAYAPKALAQDNCAPTEMVHDTLGEQYGESLIFEGLDPRGIAEIWAGDNSWSLVITRPDGISCLVAEGQDYNRYQLEANL